MLDESDEEALSTVEFVLLLILVIAEDNCELVFGLIKAIEAPRDEEARFVFALTAEVIPEVCAFVFAFMLAAKDVDAVSTVALVLALIFVCAAMIFAESEDEAAFVLLLIAV